MGAPFKKYDDDATYVAPAGPEASLRDSDDTSTLSRVHGIIEVEGPGGLKARARGYRLMDMVCLGAFLLTCYITFAVADHRTETKKDDVDTMQVIRAEAAGNSKIVIESNNRVVEAVKENTEISRDTNIAIRELICIKTLPVDVRKGAAELCRRTATSRVVGR